MRLIIAAVAACILLPCLTAQEIPLPRKDGFTGFYRVGHVLIKGPWRTQPIAPCLGNRLPTCGLGFEAVYQMTAGERPKQWSTEIALGFDFLNFQANKIDSSGYDLYGSIQTFPSITIYESWNLPTREVWREPWGDVRRVPSRWSAYGGIGTGKVTMTNVRAYDKDRKIYKLSGETWGFTPAIGLTFQVREADEHRSGLNFFEEVSYEFRNFPSASWDLPSEQKTLPDNLPRNISAKGLVVNFGFEVTFPRKKE